MRPLTLIISSGGNQLGIVASIGIVLLLLLFLFLSFATFFLFGLVASIVFIGVVNLIFIALTAWSMKASYPTYRRT